MLHTVWFVLPLGLPVVCLAFVAAVFVHGIVFVRFTIAAMVPVMAVAVRAGFLFLSKVWH